MKIKLELTEQEFADVQSALSFFVSEYEAVTGDDAPKTVRAVAKLESKFWKLLREKEGL